MSDGQNTALILSGGGARGAYAVGVVQAMVEILGLSERDRSPFDIYSGTSVGSINSSFLVANAHRGDMNVHRLREVWEGLGVNTHLQVRSSAKKLSGLTGSWFSRSLLDSRPLQLLVRRNMSFANMHRNIASGVVKASMVAAFNVGTSQTTIFSEINPELDVRPTRDPSRIEWVGRLRPDHILASSAMPFVFPVQQIGSAYYCDGGVRFNTPISPAIRAGADRLVVISLKYEREDRAHESHLDEYPNVPFLAGRLLNALLLDPFEYDLDVLERFNRLTAALEEALPPKELEHVYQVMRETRGAPYRKLEKLVFSPSQDVGKLANEHLREHLPSYKIGALPRYFLKKAATAQATWEADWATYLLFDGGYARKLIELGLRDGYAQKARIREFFRVADALRSPSQPTDRNHDPGVDGE
jgi:NTE family protein